MKSINSLKFILIVSSTLVLPLFSNAQFSSSDTSDFRPANDVSNPENSDLNNEVQQLHNYDTEQFIAKGTHTGGKIDVVDDNSKAVKRKNPADSKTNIPLWLLSCAYINIDIFSNTARITEFGIRP